MDVKFTCISCRVVFEAADIQRQHYKTDWHRYNLNRKVAGLPPVTAEEFQSRVLQQRELEEAKSKGTSVFCKICRKMFSTPNAFENHLNSKKHRSLTHSEGVDENADVGVISEHTNLSSKAPEKPVDIKESESDIETESDIEEVDSDEWEEDETEFDPNNPILHNNCLFCNHHSATMTKNLKHMTSEHSFFIPDLEYLTNMRGLLLHLGEKISNFNMCLWCSFGGKSFYSIESVQQHMRDKGHCKMLHEGATLAEYHPYYNYSKSYPDHDEHVDIDEEVESELVDSNNYELTLPSGAKIGHRSLFIYYRQNLNPNKEVSVKRRKINNLMATYRALGWKGTDKEAAARKARDIQCIRRVQAKYFAKLGVKANKLQKHFRPQVNF